MLIAAAQKPDGASLVWCNDTTYPVMAAIGVEDKGAVTTRGWYRVSPGTCLRPEMTGRPQSRLEPSPAWTVLTDSPLKGLALAREAATILAWDEGDQIYLLDTSGRHRSVSRCPGKILDAAISDDGRLVALLVEGSRLLWLSGDLEPLADRTAPPDAQALAVDPRA